VPAWLIGPLRPQSLVGTGAELVWAAVWGALAVLASASDIALPAAIGSGALLVLPALGASWMLGLRLLVALAVLVCGLELVAMAAGLLSPATAAARLLAVGAVVGLGRAASVTCAELRLARQHEVSTVMLTSRLLGRSLDRTAVAAEAVRVAAGTLALPGTELRRAVLFEVTGEAVRVMAGQDESGTATAPGIRLPLRAMPAAFRDTLAAGTAAVVPTEALTPAVRVLAGPTGAAAWAMAGVHVSGRPFGVLVVGSTDAGGFRDMDLRLLEGVARVTGLALGAALQHCELAELKERLQRSVELALEVGRSLDPEQVVGSIMARVTEGIGADQAALVRVDGDDLVVDSIYRTGPSSRLVPVARHFESPAADGVPALARALATGQPVAGGRLEARVGAEQLAAALPAGRQTLTFPFVLGGRTARVLVLSRSGGRPFGEAELARLEPMADVALLALRNAHLHDQAERAKRAASDTSERLALAIEAAKEIGSSQDLADVVRRVLRRATVVVRADRGSISVVDGDAMVLEHDHGSPSGAGAGLRWQLAGSPLAADAVRTRRALRSALADLRDPGRLEPWLRGGGLRHMIQCPLVVEDEVVGLIGLSRRRDEPFTSVDLQALQPFATLAGLLLRNARLLAEARQVGKAKSAFLNLAAHELRTPLAVIRGYLSMLEDGTYPVPDRTREEAVDTLVSKAQELESLVEALLTSARLEVGALPRAAGALDVSQAVQDALTRIRPRARLEGARIELRLPREGLVTHADRGQVARVLDNLLNNALTYSPRPAHVTVEVRAGDPIEIAVRDEGLGIPVEQRERVFERFYRVEGGASGYSPGLGLGLSISRELAQMNGGTLVLEGSEPGAGSVFVLRLPVA